MTREAARYLQQLAGAPAPPPEPLSVEELEAALEFAKTVRAPIVALEEIQDALHVARYHEEAPELEQD